MNIIFWEPPVSRKGDIAYIRISKSSTQGGIYSQISLLDALDYGNPPTLLGEYLDFDGLTTDYYKFAFLDSSTTPQVLYESAGIRFAQYTTPLSYVAELRFRIQDIHYQHYAFTCWELYRILERATQAYNYTLSLTSISAKDITPVLLKAHIQCCHILATDRAKYYRIHSGEADVDKSFSTNYYIQLASSLEQELNEIMNRQGLGLDNSMTMSDLELHKYPALYAQTGLWQRTVDTRLEIPSVTPGTPTPTIDNVLSTVFETEAIVTWETDVNSDSKIQWWIDPSDVLVSPTYDVESGVILHSIKISGLNRATTYHYKVMSGATISAEHTFTTA